MHNAKCTMQNAKMQNAKTQNAGASGGHVTMRLRSDVREEGLSVVRMGASRLMLAATVAVVGSVALKGQAGNRIAVPDGGRGTAQKCAALQAVGGRLPNPTTAVTSATLNPSTVSYDQVTQLAKALITLYYGRPPDKSYYVGCSEGGREGMMMSQRFPTHFDGILACSPGLRLPRAAVAEAWDSQSRTPCSQRAMGWTERGMAWCKTFLRARPPWSVRSWRPSLAVAPRTTCACPAPR